MKKILLLNIMLSLMIGLAACNLPTTVPTCPTDGLLAPVLISPADGSSVASTLPSLSWAYPDTTCNPEGYRIDLSTDEAFADASLSGGTGNPSTSWSPGSDLQACQVYHWRVAGINGTTLGPFSEAHSFRVDTDGECPPVAPPPSASISGIVWHDLCGLPEGPLPEPLPAGCVAAPGGGAQANGIREPGEPGIAGVEVRLHFGACTDAVVATQNTSAIGEYTFDGILAFGPHCVSVDALSAVNEPILIPGGWTFPTGTTGSLASASASLDSGSNIQQDFGWDHQFLPVVSAPPAATAAPTTPPLSEGFNVTTGANCRQGPGVVYDVVSAFPAGTSLKVVGRNTDSSWWQVEVNSTVRCWISNVTGQFVGNPGAIQVVAAPPTPTPAADSTPPSLSGQLASQTTIYYFSTACGPTTVDISVKATDPSGIKDVSLRYRYVGPAFVGAWRTAGVATVSGDEYKFSVDTVNEANSDLQGLNGTFEYQFIATDKAENSVTYPASPLSIVLNYCQ